MAMRPPFSAMLMDENRLLIRGNEEAAHGNLIKTGSRFADGFTSFRAASWF
jgi:hypothetical protein